MDEHTYAPSPSSPTVAIQQREAEDEKQPLLRSGEAGRKDSQRRATQDSRVDVVRRMRHWNWRNLIVLATVWLAYGVFNCAYSVMGPFFPNEALAKGSSSTTTGIIVSATPLCVAIFSPLVGYFLPTLGLRYTLVSGLFLVGGACVLLGLMSLMPSGWVFILFGVLLRMTEGVGAAMFTTAAYALLAELFPNNVATVMGVFEVATGLGYAVGPPLGGFLYEAGGFKLPFIAMGGTVLVFIPLTFLLVGKMSLKGYKTNKRMSLKTIVKVSTSLNIIILVLANILGLAAMGFSTPTLETFLTTNVYKVSDYMYYCDRCHILTQGLYLGGGVMGTFVFPRFHLTPEQVGLVFLSGAISYMLLSLVAGQLADTFGPRWFEIIGFFICGIGSVFTGPADFIAEPNLWITTVAFTVIGAGGAFALVPIYSDMLTLATSLNVGEDQDVLSSVISGIASSSMSVGQFAGPLIGGVLVQLVQFQGTSLIFGEVLFAEAFLLLGASLIDLCYKRRTQQ